MNPKEQDHKVTVVDSPGRNQSAAKIWAFVTIDQDGNESVCGQINQHGALPMIFSKWDLVERFRPIMREVVKNAPPGLRVVLRVYSQATDIEEIK